MNKTQSYWFLLVTCLLFWLVALMYSCTKKVEPVIDSPPAGSVSFWPNKEWDKIAIDAIKKSNGFTNILPKDMDLYCPNYKNLKKDDQISFYVALMSALAYYESSYNPKESYTEDFPDANGRPVVSMGLLQLSKESGNSRKYNCGIKDANELYDVTVNINCAVKILSYWIVADQYIGKNGSSNTGFARYWGPFRKPKRFEAMQEKTRGLSICKVAK